MRVKQGVQISLAQAQTKSTYTGVGWDPLTWIIENRVPILTNPIRTSGGHTLQGIKISAAQSRYKPTYTGVGWDPLSWSIDNTHPFLYSPVRKSGGRVVQGVQVQQATAEDKTIYESVGYDFKFTWSNLQIGYPTLFHQVQAAAYGYVPMYKKRELIWQLVELPLPADV